MKQRGYTAPAAARALGVNPRTVQRWLSGHRSVPGWLKLYIAGKLDPKD